MKEMLFSTLLTMTLIAFGAVPVTVSAAEPVETGSRLDAAKAYFIENMMIGFNVSIRISGGPALPPEQIAAIRKKSAQWLNEDWIPFLRRNDLLDEWVAMQFDKDIREINRKTAEAKNINDITKLTNDTMALTKLRYPDSFAKYTSRECAAVMQKLKNALLQALSE